MELKGCFPVSASKVGLAYEAHGDNTKKVIGVTIQVLVETGHVKELPEPWKKIAQDMLYKNATEET